MSVCVRLCVDRAMVWEWEHVSQQAVVGVCSSTRAHTHTHTHKRKIRHITPE